MPLFPIKLLRPLCLLALALALPGCAWRMPDLWPFGSDQAEEAQAPAQAETAAQPAPAQPAQAEKTPDQDLAARAAQGHAEAQRLLGPRLSRQHGPPSRLRQGRSLAAQGRGAERPGRHARPGRDPGGIPRRRSPRSGPGGPVAPQGGRQRLRAIPGGPGRPVRPGGGRGQKPGGGRGLAQTGCGPGLRPLPVRTGRGPGAGARASPRTCPRPCAGTRPPRTRGCPRPRRVSASSTRKARVWIRT